MTKTNKEHRKIKSPAILPRIVILLFLIMIEFFINIDSFCYLLNHNSYEETAATVTKATTDDLLMLIPKVELTYSYEGTEYTEEKYFVLAPLFGLSRVEGTTLTLYVNTYAPAYSLFKVNFFRNVVNWLLLVLIGVCIANIVQRVKKSRENKKQREEGA